METAPGEYFEVSYSTIYMSRNRKKNWDKQSFTIQASGRQAPHPPGGLPMKKIGHNKWIFNGENRLKRFNGFKLLLIGLNLVKVINFEKTGKLFLKTQE